MRTIQLLALTVCLFVPCLERLATGAEPVADWTPVTGKWRLDREIVPIICQDSETGSGLILSSSGAKLIGACRAVVKVSPDTAEAGLWLDADPHAVRGLQILLGRCSNVGGFLVRTAEGRTLWEDRFAPWSDYQPYVLEAVVEAGRLRVQMFEGTGEILISQSPWIVLGEGECVAGGSMGLFTTQGRARFLGFQRDVEPLSELVADPPNKRRLQNDEGSWDLQGDGRWMWTTAERQRVRQYAKCERSWAVFRDVTGTHRVWECRVRVDRDTGGTGMFFLYRNEDDKGFLAWLGGQFGDGALMLIGYKPAPKTLWSSPQGRWHWDTEYVLRAETRQGQVRIQQLAADGVTVISDSNWVKVDGKSTNEPGYLGLHTWRGPAEFWAFTEKSTGARATSGESTTGSLGRAWLTLGDGEWKWAEPEQKRLVQVGSCRQAAALNIMKGRAQGTSSCFVRKSPAAKAAGVVFQADRSLTSGFLALMTDAGPRLESLSGKTLWQADQWAAGATGEYRLEGVVTTDRVAMRVYDGKDPSRLLLASPDIYVPESNNSRVGYSGVVARGAAEFRRTGKDWCLVAADE